MKDLIKMMSEFVIISNNYFKNNAQHLKKWRKFKKDNGYENVDDEKLIKMLKGDKNETINKTFIYIFITNY
ncbi:MAG: hypothetical protein ACOCP8_00405 [archaeon]